VQKAAGLGDSELGRTSVNTGLVLKQLGRLEESTRAYRDGIAALERAHGPRHATVAKSLGNLANVLAARGQYPEARAHLDRAVELWRALHGDDHIDTATALNNLSALLKEMGDLASALPMTRRVLATFEKHYGPRSDEVAVVTDNLASLLGDLGRYDEAEPLYRRALAIHEERLGKDHPAVATGLNNIGWLLRVSGRADQSLPYYERALAINLAKFGKKHPTVAASHGQLGVAYGAVGKLQQARLHLGRAKRINEKALGRSHPNLALVVSELAQVEAVAKRSRQARTLSERSLSIVERHLEPLLYATSQRERLELVGLHRRKVDLFLSLHGSARDARRAYDRVLRWKAIVLTSLVAQRQAVLASSSGALASKVGDLARVRTELANLSMAVPRSNERARVTARLALLGQRKDRLERELSARSAAFGAGQRAIDADYRAVCRALEPGRALVDYYRYLRTSLGGARAWHVAAFVSVGGRCKSPVRVELGPASAIDEAVAELRAAVEDGGQTEQVLRPGDRVRALAWDPLASALGNSRWVWLSTDGSLNEVPFAALPVRGTIDGVRARFLIEAFTFSHIASGKEILRHAERPRGRSATRALIVGGLTYDSASTGKNKSKGKEKGKRKAPPDTRGADCGIQSRPEYEFLGGSEAEATSVRRALSAEAANATLLSGARGDEKTIKSELGRSNVVHLATHGFFARPCAPRSAGDSAAGAEDQTMSNPLLRSGIVLSGANATRGRPMADGEDGVLTAEEVAALDLRQLQLAVLSACETALGDIASGEGVLGLRWAFAIAGTHALVMSLWKVPDAETRALMTELYRAAGGAHDRPAALRSAQLAMLRARRAEGDPNPWSWAAFIASGR
jgi:CHAT domain-containing protein/Tfp pilus assembly protein PilF